MKYIITPLEENYKTIPMRVTEIESFNNCQFKHKFWKQEFATNDAFLFGTLVHSVLQAYFYKPEAGLNTLDLICRQYDAWCSTIYDYISLVENALLPQKYNIFTNEYKNIVEIECGKYLIILEGTIDAIGKDSNWWYTLIDFKTSKAEWKPEDYDAKIQKYLYTWMLAQLVGKDMIQSFDYIILTKHVKPRLQILSYTPDWEYIDKFVNTLFTDYVNALEVNIRNPSINKQCFFCPLKSTCPAQTTTSDSF